MNTAADGTNYPSPSALPSISNYGLVSARGKQDASGAWNYELTFEGHGGVGGSSSSTPDQATIAVYAFEPSDLQIPISQNPNWNYIRDTYGTIQNDGTVKFDPNFNPDDSDTGPSKGNPFYLVDSYLSFGATWSKTWCLSATIPTDLFQNVETIVTSVPTPSYFAMPTFDRNRNWLKRMPTIRARGQAVEVTERYVLSGAGGWNTDLYKSMTTAK
jgi:hypothetical protein